MKMMAANGVLEGLKYIDMGVSESCLMEKYRRVSFTKATRELKKVRLGMVHIDVWGPSRVSSFLVPKFHWLDVSHLQRQLYVFLRLVRYLTTTLFLLTLSRHYNFNPLLSYMVNIHSLMSEDIL